MRTPGLGRCVAARTASIFGDRIADAALPIIILLTTGDALLAGLVTAANVVPTLLFSLPIGHLVDKQERRRLMIVSDVWRLLLAAALAFSLTSSEPSAIVLVTVAFLMGFGDVLFSVSAQAYLPALA